MLLTGETPLTVCALMTLMCVARPNSLGMVVVDRQRVMDVDYVGGGTGKFLDRFAKAGMSCRYRHTDRAIQLGNGSGIRFFVVASEDDALRFMGMEPHMIAIDRTAILPNSVIRKIQCRDRTGFDMPALKALNTGTAMKAA